MTVRHSFVEHFGEEQATKVEESSLGHMRDAHDGHQNDKWGDDPFQYHLLTCIAFDCFKVDKNREFHGITVPLEELRTWVLEYAHLHEYAGDIPDYLALMVGAYNPWINWEQAGAERPENMDENEAELNRFREMSPDEALTEMRNMAEDILGTLNDHGDFEAEE